MWSNLTLRELSYLSGSIITQSSILSIFLIAAIFFKLPFQIFRLFDKKKIVCEFQNWLFFSVITNRLTSLLIFVYNCFKSGYAA
jgi:hypothetical protein